MKHRLETLGRSLKLRDTYFVLFVVDGLFLNDFSRSSLPSPQHPLCTLLSGSIGPNRAPWSQILEHLVDSKHQGIKLFGQGSHCRSLHFCLHGLTGCFHGSLWNPSLGFCMEGSYHSEHEWKRCGKTCHPISPGVGSVATVDLGFTMAMALEQNALQYECCLASKYLQHLIASKANMSKFISLSTPEEYNTNPLF